MIETPIIALVAHEPSPTTGEINQLLRRFWEMEDGTERKFISPEDRQCERHFTDTISRTTDGRYVVRLPFNEKINLLGRSKQSAIRQFLSNEKKMERDPEFGMAYRQFMQEFIDLGHMQLIHNDKEKGYYTPHHGVLSANKFRTVFNASCPTSSGISLNECQMTGPKLQIDLPVILNRFRRFK